ncbi:hypothetical protein GCM10010462_27960 [Microbacterium dextranolyticum]|uniref:Uncharacterized protein n=1 Tax=Microbacterium dextranolyticum TaxID=36806 RepID=A0A9W6HPR6_9MICO|nr:hypothetical protein GCM10017591_24170 [Microbacterium dextranolyticum]
MRIIPPREYPWFAFAFTRQSARARYSSIVSATETVRRDAMGYSFLRSGVPEEPGDADGRAWYDHTICCGLVKRKDHMWCVAIGRRHGSTRALTVRGECDRVKR